MIQYRKIFRRLSKRQGNLDALHVDATLAYIDSYWDTLTCTNKVDHGTIIGLPHPYIVPANDKKAAFTFQEQYYWDSYFTALGLVNTKRWPIAEGMLENLIYLFERFGLIPNSSRAYHLSHSQPPVLTSYIRLVYDQGRKDHAWLKQHMAVAEKEYDTVWMNTAHPLWHQVHKGLSRYYDIHVLHDLAETESGWDMTPRFERKCLDYLPIDLNCLLYKYEQDLAWAAKECSQPKAAEKWRRRAADRKKTISELMWHERKGFFFDYNYNTGKLSDIWSLAGVFPLWAGVATKEQAARIVKNLQKFDHVGGLSITTKPLIDMSIFGSIKTQWAYPNGWAPPIWIVAEGLKNYGYDAEAKIVARKWLHTNLLWFERHGVFLEKYNVVKPTKHPVEGVYPSQTGFGWTNAIFAALCREWLDGEG